MELFYHSTRSNEQKVRASEAIISGLSKDGGLFVPDRIPAMDFDLASISKMSYQELAFEVMKLFFTDYTQEELKSCIQNAYDEKFDTKEIAPLVKSGDSYFLELFHGETIAFKDMALSILPHLLAVALKKHKIEKEVVILTATSGDTGKAALAGFSDVEGTKIIVFYPKEGVSKIQELQMVTQKGDNTYVIGIRGNFDQAQTGVKAMFESTEMAKQLEAEGYQFSSANSINIGRLIPQVVYYFYAYAQLLKKGEIEAGDEIQFVVPTGNFGNILAGYYAMKMGLPIQTLVCASNENKVLYDFFETGNYNKNREFFVTTSPSMDILISSNLERLLFHIADENVDETAKLMQCLQENGTYDISKAMQKGLQSFLAGVGTQEEGAKDIQDTFEKTNYLMDPHTAVAAVVAKKNAEKKVPTVIVSTASPYKFASSVMSALDAAYEDVDELSLINEMKKVSKVEIPEAVHDAINGKIRHTKVCNPDEMRMAVEDILGL